jgi:hypothetical protein
MVAWQHGSIGADEGFGAAVRVSCYFTVRRPADFLGWLGWDFRLAGDELFGLAVNTRAASFNLLINMQSGCTAG